MWVIRQIFDGDYGCEELRPGEKPRLSVTLENERGEQRYERVEDEWLTAQGLEEGSSWPLEDSFSNLFYFMHPELKKCEVVDEKPGSTWPGTGRTGAGREAGTEQDGAEHTFEEMILRLQDAQIPEYTCHDDDVTFGFYHGDRAALETAVKSVEEDWFQWFPEGARVYCGMKGGEIASFCLVEPMGEHEVSAVMAGSVGASSAGNVSTPGAGGNDMKVLPSETVRIRIAGPGCVGTVLKFRNQGIGLEMVRRVTQLLKEEGYDWSYIHYTGVADWYARLGYERVLRWKLVK